MSDGWMQHSAPFPGDRRIQEVFTERWIALGAPPEMALFDRHTPETHVYLLSPRAAAAFPTLAGVDWHPAIDRKDHEWVVSAVNHQPSAGLTPDPKG